MLLNMASEQQGNLSASQHFIIGSVFACVCVTARAENDKCVCISRQKSILPMGPALGPVSNMNDHAALWLAALRCRCWWCFTVPSWERGADKRLSPQADSLITGVSLILPSSFLTRTKRKCSVAWNLSIFVLLWSRRRFSRSSKTTR